MKIQRSARTSTASRTEPRPLCNSSVARKADATARTSAPPARNARLNRSSVRNEGVWRRRAGREAGPLMQPQIRRKPPQSKGAAILRRPRSLTWEGLRRARDLAFDCGQAVRPARTTEDEAGLAGNRRVHGRGGPSRGGGGGNRD